MTGLILGLVAVPFSCIGAISILAVIFSAIGIGRIKERGGKGKIQGAIGLILGILCTLVYLRQYGHLR